MLQKKIKYAPVAVDDMDEIFSYISHDKILAAETLLNKLNDRIATLAEFPQMGTVLSDEEYTIVKQGYRFIVVHPYLIFYRITNDTVIIHRILHGRRDYLRELF
ncbi:type II toxin-antitoxin system RelE/ParE family toxin [Oceanobacillus bengalensis]|uniref:Type II toxin-antitoxin system RelE/ParE family toxin n=1 Tax=Oceanobacillus bengalensis TaxID=1435466 RepID=A0A494Z198_9BACI|nr:type II toxin-antitoxin system RelE/ParE family toxin [Oceanobacillus bengalensis]RKQ16277.1 type II toxin-antitoxin system RelE/ParE family toxin [Oceanobacillus bengalensis]